MAATVTGPPHHQAGQMGSPGASDFSSFAVEGASYISKSHPIRWWETKTKLIQMLYDVCVCVRGVIE